MKSEPTKWLPILLSVIAVGVSCLSWWEGHRGRIINEEVNRPILALTNPQTTFSSQKHYLAVSLSYTLKNVGKVEAQVTNIEIGNPIRFQMYGTDIPETLSCKLSPPPDILSQTAYPKVLPGLEASYEQTFSVDKDCEKLRKLRFPGVSIMVTYSDAATGRLYIQRLSTDMDLDFHGDGVTGTSP